ncbi:MAG: cysteine hydrolase [Desulfoplanes sp.]|nr:cysteine hydrolase [Desulfoplanes sp.]MDD4649407.1 cysteine hydrolase [Desulfoplanes sp.]
MMETSIPSRTALLIIDMQNDFVLPGAPVCVAGARGTIASIKKVLTYFRARHFPVFHVTREYRADGSDVEKMRQAAFLDKHPCVVPGTSGCAIVAELTPLPDEYRIIKNRFSAFMCTELNLILRRFGINHLVVTGTQLPNCVRATVFDAVCLDYEITLITDGTSAQTPEIAAANILDMANIGVHCTTADDFLSPD